MKNLILAFSFLLLASCTYSVHMVNFSDSRPYGAKGAPVKAESEQFVVLGFAFDTVYVDQAYAKLQRTCPGTVTGIVTKYYTDHGFFSWTNHIVMEGFCVAKRD